MSDQLAQIVLPPPFPDHTQLPESDGSFVNNFQEHPQSEQERQRAEQAQARAASLAERLQAMGVNLDDQEFS